MNKQIIVKGLDENGERISTQIFEELVQEAFTKSHDLVLETYGQHNVGGRLKSGGETVNIEINGPCGQRVGCMGMPGTKIVVNGPASDDVGWLNIGADITVKGDATNGVCNAMAEGKVYIGGSIGARGLTMTKWNPEYKRPELWILGSCGDSFAEFNCGGVAVVCGIDAKTPDNVLGYRPCVGMVGGSIYYHGKIDKSYSQINVKAVLLSDEQWQWLMDNLPVYLKSIDRMELLEQLSKRDEWSMLDAIPPQERALMKTGPMPMSEFVRTIWNPGFGGGDPLRDLAPGLDRSPIGLIETGDLRRKKPFWANRDKAAPCAYYCPVHIPTIDRLKLMREGKGDEAYEMLMEYTPLPASVCGHICPNLCMKNCSRQKIDEKIDVQMLGRAAKDKAAPKAAPSLGKKVAIVGGGPAGMNAAWQLAKSGVEAHIFEKDNKIGGKLAQVIPWERMPKAIWDAEIARFMSVENITVDFDVDMTKEKFSELQNDFDHVIVAVGTHSPRTIPFPGHEKVIPALDFLKDAKSKNPTKLKGNVVIIGAGNVGCDVACDAYALGAEQVTLVDIQQPLAFGKEKAAAEALGAKFKWPVMTKEVTDEGLVDAAGHLIPADTVIISIGDVPALKFLPDSVEVITVGGAGWVKCDPAGRTSDPKISAVGDVERPGLATNALGAGKNVADSLIAEFKGEEYKPFAKDLIPQMSLTHTHYAPDNQCGVSESTEADRCMSCGTCRDCHLCETICPEGAISREKLPDDSFQYVSEDDKCIACGFCADTCPCGIWLIKPF
ncbi:MAG: FAD-dependent oxidoreductase [Desulfobulbaceae bacterium]|jgi:NADPH-dependent glutamate synthase beta subunit-like oxidoreductase/glutamate synthase domain-containing protein 3/ferredoxin|nr:FAD-dependent oxidoreductase [Desulfobulbaceae bacterium]